MIIYILQPMWSHRLICWRRVDCRCSNGRVSRVPNKKKLLKFRRCLLFSIFWDFFAFCFSILTEMRNVQVVSKSWHHGINVFLFLIFICFRNIPAAIYVSNLGFLAL